MAHGSSSTTRTRPGDETASIHLTSSSPASWTPNTSSTWQTTTTNWSPTSASLRMANVSSSRAICSDPLTFSLSRSINLLHLQLMYSRPPNWHSVFPRSHHLLPTMSNGEGDRYGRFQKADWWGSRNLLKRKGDDRK